MENVSKMSNYLSSLLFGRGNGIDLKSNQESYSAEFKDNLNRSIIEKEKLLCESESVNVIGSHPACQLVSASPLYDLDDTPIILGNTELAQASCSVAHLVNSMLSMLLEFENSSIYISSKMLFLIGYLMRDDQRESPKNQCMQTSCSSSDLYNYKVKPYYFPLFIMAFNLAEQIKRISVKTFDYKKEKKKILKKMEEMNKKKKERMAQFAAGFEFDIG
ncbi:MAG: hypothetical protein ACI4UM_05095 [Succinivibrio sp.]